MKDFKTNAKIESNIITACQVTKERLLICIIEKNSKEVIGGQEVLGEDYSMGYAVGCEECVELIKLHIPELLKMAEKEE